MAIRIGSLRSDTIVGTSSADVIIDLAGANSLFGGGGADVITAGFGRDLLDGGAGHDSLAGWAADDRLIGGAGNDALDGGSGVDTAVFSGDRAGYVITALGGGVIQVRDIAPTVFGNDGTDRLIGIERLAFRDGTVASDEPANAKPVAIDDELGGVAEDSGPRTISFEDLTGNDIDSDGDPLTVTGVGNAHGGAVEILGGAIVFTADADFNGAAGFDYTVSDGRGGSDLGTVAFEVTPVNDGPVAVDDVLEPMAEDDERTIAFAALTDNDQDDDHDGLTVAGVSGAIGGSVVILDGAIVFTADADFNGAAGFGYTVNDGHGGSDLGSVSFDVTPVNDDPVAVDDVLADIDQNSGAYGISFGVLTENDRDVDGDTLSVSAVEAITGGDVSIQGGAVVFTPATDYSGTAAFEYTLSDGHGGVDNGRATFEILTSGPRLFTSGADTVDLNAFDLTQYPGSGATNALAGNDNVVLSATQNLGVLFIGGGGDDTIDGSVVADRIDGAADNDRLSGGNGNDSLFGGDGDDTLIGGNGRDFAYGGDGNDTVQGDLGGDSLHGGGGNDLLVDDVGEDELYGGDGDDSLAGGTGNDIYQGGQGADSIDGGTSIDTLLYSGVAVQVDLGNNANNHFGEAEGDRIINMERVHGTANGDWLTGNANANSLFGEDGGDTLTGAAGNDFLTGGAGDDHFVFAVGSDVDSIEDFERGADQIDLTRYADIAFADLVLVTGSGSTVIDLGSAAGSAAGSDVLTVRGVTDLDASDFMFA